MFKHPVIKTPDVSGIQVSISHCKNIALAIAFNEEHPMGIDLEEIDDTKIDALNYVITAQEKWVINAYKLEFLTGATMIWSAKESLSKALKTGFTTDSNIFEINNLTRVGQSYVCTFTNFTQYKACIEICGSYIYSIALPLNTQIELNAFSAIFDDFVKSSV